MVLWWVAAVACLKYAYGLSIGGLSAGYTYDVKYVSAEDGPLPSWADFEDITNNPLTELIDFDVYPQFRDDGVLPLEFCAPFFHYENTYFFVSVNGMIHVSSRVGYPRLDDTVTHTYRFDPHFTERCPTPGVGKGFMYPVIGAYVFDFDLNQNDQRYLRKLYRSDPATGVKSVIVQWSNLMPYKDAGAPASSMAHFQAQLYGNGSVAVRISRPLNPKEYNCSAPEPRVPPQPFISLGAPALDPVVYRPPTYPSSTSPSAVFFDRRTPRSPSSASKRCGDAGTRSCQACRATDGCEWCSNVRQCVTSELARGVCSGTDRYCSLADMPTGVEGTALPQSISELLDVTLFQEDPLYSSTVVYDAYPPVLTDKPSSDPQWEDEFNGNFPSLALREGDKALDTNITLRFVKPIVMFGMHSEPAFSFEYMSIPVSKDEPYYRPYPKIELVNPQAGTIVVLAPFTATPPAWSDRYSPRADRSVRETRALFRPKTPGDVTTGSVIVEFPNVPVYQGMPGTESVFVTAQVELDIGTGRVTYRYAPSSARHNGTLGMLYGSAGRGGGSGARVCRAYSAPVDYLAPILAEPSSRSSFQWTTGAWVWMTRSTDQSVGVGAHVPWPAVAPGSSIVFEPVQYCDTPCGTRTNRAGCNRATKQCVCNCATPDSSCAADARAQCTSCANGYYGDRCQHACSCVHGLCDGGIAGSGRCLACDREFAGVNCSVPCHCVHGMCGITSVSGECTRCDDGWSGLTCSECAIGHYGSRCEPCPCPAGVECDYGTRGTGQCTDKCRSGFARSGNRTSGACDICEEGRVGPNCQVCCEHGTCIDGACGECKPGHYGPQCTPCACDNVTHCADGVQGSGECICNADQHGPRCTHNCTCVNGKCDPISKKCWSCDPGYIGLNCDVQCPSCDHGKCVSLFGRVICVCDDGYGGSACDVPCPCRRLWNGTLGGSCVGTQCLCFEGFTGRDCTQCAVGFVDAPNGAPCGKCATDWYGSAPNCRKCNCVSDHTLRCDERRGCICFPQYIGDRCEREALAAHVLDDTSRYSLVALVPLVAVGVCMCFVGVAIHSLRRPDTRGQTRDNPGRDSVRVLTLQSKPAIGAPVLGIPLQQVPLLDLRTALRDSRRGERPDALLPVFDASGNEITWPWSYDHDAPDDAPLLIKRHVAEVAAADSKISTRLFPPEGSDLDFERVAPPWMTGEMPPLPPVPAAGRGAGPGGRGRGGPSPFGPSGGSRGGPFRPRPSSLQSPTDGASVAVEATGDGVASGRGGTRASSPVPSAVAAAASQLDEVASDEGADLPSPGAGSATSPARSRGRESRSGATRALISRSRERVRASHRAAAVMAMAEGEWAGPSRHRRSRRT